MSTILRKIYFLICGVTVITWAFQWVDAAKSVSTEGLPAGSIIYVLVFLVFSIIILSGFFYGFRYIARNFPHISEGYARINIFGPEINLKQVVLRRLYVDSLGRGFLIELIMEDGRRHHLFTCSDFHRTVVEIDQELGSTALVEEKKIVGAHAFLYFFCVGLLLLLAIVKWQY